MTSIEISPKMPTRRLLSGLHIPDFGDDTAPLDVSHLRDDPEPALKQEPTREQPRREPPAPSSAPVEQSRPTNPAPASPSMPVVQPEPIKPPIKPDAEHFKMERALNVGYWMSVAVGAIGQVVSFGGMIAPNLSQDLQWTAYLAAAMLAAFAEITMVGCGTSALKRRYNEGAWKALATIACCVCLYATALNAIHWAPVDPGMAVMFAGGSFLGFTAHFIAEHTAASDYEKALARYRKATQAQQSDAPTGTVKPAAGTPKVPSKPRPSAPKTKTAKSRTNKSNVATKDVAVQLGVQHRADTPATLARVLHDAGYRPASESSIKNWCREIKAQLNK